MTTSPEITKRERPFDYAPATVPEATEAREKPVQEMSMESIEKFVEREQASLDRESSSLIDAFDDGDLDLDSSDITDLSENTIAMRNVRDAANTEINNLLSTDSTELNVVAPLKPASIDSKPVPTYLEEKGNVFQAQLKQESLPAPDRKDLSPPGETHPAEVEQFERDKEGEKIIERAREHERELSKTVLGELQARLDQAAERGDHDAVSFWVERLAKERARIETESAMHGAVKDEMLLEDKLGKKIGVTQPRVLEIEGGLEGVYKPLAAEEAPDDSLRRNFEAVGMVEGVDTLYQREWLAGQIARILAMDEVPVTVIRGNGAGIGSVQAWVDGTNVRDAGGAWNVRMDAGQLESLAILDVLTGNGDRREVNMMLDKDGNAHAIDNGFTFQPNEYRSGGNYETGNLVMMSLPLEMTTRRATNEFVANNPDQLLTQPAGKPGNINVMLSNPGEAPRTPLSESAQRHLDLLLADTPGSKAIRDQLGKAFGTALGKESDQYLAEFILRAKTLQEKGFPAHLSFEKRSADSLPTSFEPPESNLPADIGFANLT